METHKHIRNINDLYNKHYKLMLFLPALLLVLSFLIIGNVYLKTGGIFYKDVSLTGGTTISILTQYSADELKNSLINNFPDIEVRSLSDNSGKQTQLVVITGESIEKIKPEIEKIFGKLTDQNSSIESTGSNLSQDFYKQLLIAVLIAFFWMAAVVFVIFAPKWKIKILAIIINLLFGIFLGKMFLTLNFYLASIILLGFAISLIFIYVKYSIPSFAVMSCAFADIIMTLAIVDLLGMKVSGAGIVAFLMLIGYSVDTDILLTTRVLRRKESSVNKEIFSSFKTGMTMTLTAIVSVLVALFFVYPFGTSLNQIFIILIIGLSFDILNTWITNTSLIKWFVEKNENSS
jgi:preprotein translocase subunit SecF